MAQLNILTIAIFAIIVPLTFVYGEEHVVELTATNFNQKIKENNYFVKFYAPWCGHCKRLQPLWEELAEMMNVKEDPNVIIAKVDCTQHQQLCADNEVTGYPTLRFFKLQNDESVKFKGIRDMATITEFINEQLNVQEENEIPNDDVVPKGGLVDLTESTFAKHVSSGNHFVKFYAPWCTHCQDLAPTWDALAKAMETESTVSIAKIDCTKYRSICQDFDVKGYPTLLWIEDGKKIEKYSGTRELEGLSAYVKKMLGVETAKIETEKKPEQKHAEQKVIQLNADDFVSAISDGITFVKFYAPWCGHCQKMSPTWDQLAEKMYDVNKDVKIAKVDCSAAQNVDLCAEQHVEGFPTLFAYKNGEQQTEYEGTRSLAELQHFITKFIGHDEL